MAFNEYRAAHGHGSGWSWDMAKRHSKMKDLIASQGADWDDEMALARLNASAEPLAKAFDPERRLKAVKTPCTEQIRARLSERWEVRPQHQGRKRTQGAFGPGGDRISDLPLHQGTQKGLAAGSGEAGMVIMALRVAMAQVQGRGRLRARGVITGRDYIEQAMVLCMNAKGRQIALELDGACDPIRVVYEFADGTRLIVTSDGCF
jgi:hypothetical protein